MDINDKVVTHHGETGIIVRPAPKTTVYDWWVSFKATTRDGKNITCCEPYRKSELTKVD